MTANKSKAAVYFEEFKVLWIFYVSHLKLISLHYFIKKGRYVR